MESNHRLLRLARLQSKDRYVEAAFVRIMQTEDWGVPLQELGGWGKQLSREGFHPDDVIEMANRLIRAAAQVREESGVPLLPTREQMRNLCRTEERKRKEREWKQEEADRVWATSILQCLKNAS
jgi:hypothetical protein